MSKFYPVFYFLKKKTCLNVHVELLVLISLTCAPNQALLVVAIVFMVEAITLVIMMIVVGIIIW